VDEPRPSKSQLHPVISSGYDVEASVNNTAEPSFCGSGDQLNPADGPRSSIVTSCVISCVEESSSVTISLTAYTPWSMNVNVGFFRVDVPKPPKSQLHPMIISGDELDRSVNATVEPSS